MKYFLMLFKLMNRDARRLSDYSWKMLGTIIPSGPIPSIRYARGRIGDMTRDVEYHCGWICYEAGDTLGEPKISMR